MNYDQEGNLVEINGSFRELYKDIRAKRQHQKVAVRHHAKYRQPLEVNGIFRDAFNRIKDRRRAEGKGSIFSEALKKITGGGNVSIDPSGNVQVMSDGTTAYPTERLSETPSWVMPAMIAGAALLMMNKK